MDFARHACCSTFAGTPFLGASYAVPRGSRAARPRRVHRVGRRRPARRCGRSRSRIPTWSGALVTAGDVAFYGTLDGWFKSVDAKTGKVLSKFKVGSGVVGNPITYPRAGRQAVRRRVRRHRRRLVPVRRRRALGRSRGRARAGRLRTRTSGATPARAAWSGSSVCSRVLAEEQYETQPIRRRAPRCTARDRLRSTIRRQTRLLPKPAPAGIRYEANVPAGGAGAAGDAHQATAAQPTPTAPRRAKGCSRR